jgi:ADP-ribose pyrophosphatase
MQRNDVEIEEEYWLHRGFLSLKHYRLRHKLFSGDWSATMSREVVIRRHAAAALPYDPDLDKVVLLEQFRIGALEDTDTPWLIEIVAGLVEKEESDEALVAREVQEEAGLVALDIIPIYKYWSSPGGSNELVSLFCVKVDASQAEGVYGLKEEHEDIRVFSVSSDEAFDMLSRGKIRNAVALIALQWLQLNKQAVIARWT